MVQLTVKLAVCSLQVLAELSDLSRNPVLFTDIVDDCALDFKVCIGFKLYVLVNIKGVDCPDKCNNPFVYNIIGRGILAVNIAEGNGYYPYEVKIAENNVVSEIDISRNTVFFNISD